MTRSLRDHDREPVHPGAILEKDTIPAYGLTKTELAKRLGVSRVLLSRICAQKAPVTPNVALRLGALFGTGADIWFDLQARYDMWHAAKRFDPGKIGPALAKGKVVV